MSFHRKMAAIVFALYSLASASSPAQGSHDKRPYTSQDDNIDRILEIYHQQQPETPKCGEGETVTAQDTVFVNGSRKRRKKRKANVTYTVNIVSSCLGGGDPVYRLKIIRQNGTKEEEFIEDLDGKMNERDMFISLSDTYEVRKEGKEPKTFDFGMSEEISKKDKRYIQNRYSATLKETKRALENKYAKKKKN